MCDLEILSGGETHSNTHGCPQCISSQLSKLKIAVALVVLRNKPVEQDIKTFVENLTVFHQDRERKWKDEYYRLKQEVLQLRQQQLLFEINNKIDESPQSNAVISRKKRRLPDHSLELLTPPDSQQSFDSSEILSIDEQIPTSRKPDDEADIDRTKFFRAYFYLEHHFRLNRPIEERTNCSNVLENDVICKSVLSVLQHVDRTSTKEYSDFQKCRQSLQICVRMLDRHNKWSAGIRERFGELFSSWLQRVKQKAITNVFEHYALLETIVDSDGMAVKAADILVNSIVESQQVISEWDWNGKELIPQNILADFSNASYSVLLLEKTIPRLTPTDKVRFMPVLSHIETRVHLNFPLFAASIMRLAHQFTD